MEKLYRQTNNGQERRPLFLFFSTHTHQKDQKLCQADEHILKEPPGWETSKHTVSIKGIALEPNQPGSSSVRLPFEWTTMLLCSFHYGALAGKCPTRFCLMVFLHTSGGISSSIFLSYQASLWRDGLEKTLIILKLYMSQKQPSSRVTPKCFGSHCIRVCLFSKYTNVESIVAWILFITGQ